MTRKVVGLFFTVVLAFSWVAPLCAQSSAPSHACCVGGEAPQPTPSKGQVPACCRASEALPAVVVAAVSAPVPVLLPSAMIVAEPSCVYRVELPRFVPASPQAPPGMHSGLSPPSSGL